MPLDDDLFSAAAFLADGANDYEQARRRRAVSTAYYALFHLLVGSAVNLWPVEKHRGALTRTIDHGHMKKVCEAAKKDKSAVPELITVATNFIALQEQREKADYDVSVDWSDADTWSQIGLLVDAQEAWRKVASEDAAEFLFRLLFPKVARR